MSRGSCNCGGSVDGWKLTLCGKSCGFRGSRGAFETHGMLGGVDTHKISSQKTSRVESNDEMKSTLVHCALAAAQFPPETPPWHHGVRFPCSGLD